MRLDMGLYRDRNDRWRVSFLREDGTRTLGIHCPLPDRIIQLLFETRDNAERHTDTIRREEELADGK